VCTDGQSQNQKIRRVCIVQDNEDVLVILFGEKWHAQKGPSSVVVIKSVSSSSWFIVPFEKT
jgi:hypothetical protein